MLSDAQRKAYMKNPDHCPYCGGDETEVVMTENHYEGSYQQRITCHECGRSWIEGYLLTAIAEIPEGERSNE